MMKRNCNLELRLVTPCVYSHHHRSMADDDKDTKQHLTFFCNGRIAVCDATELQARAILWLASREVEDKSSSSSSASNGYYSPRVATWSRIYSPTAGVSMKESLKNFLEKRKSRAQATSPYPIPKI